MLNKHAYRFVILLIGVFAIPANTFGQVDWRAEIKKDLVEVQNGQFKAAENMIVNFQGNNIQVRYEAEGSAEFISRDQFVAIHQTLGTMFLIAMLEEAGATIDQIDIKSIDELIGDADITIKFIMAKNGMQIQIITGEGTEKMTMTWEELYQ